MIFKFWNSKPEAVDKIGQTITRHKSARFYSLQPTNLVAAMLAGALLLTGCQQQTDSTVVDDDSQTNAQTDSENTKPAPLSASAKARIAQFQPLYVTQMQGLQRRLQAEYEALQAADASDSATPSLLDGASEPVENITDQNDTNASADISANTSADDASNAVVNEASSDAEAEINVSTEVGERDLEVLKRISLEPRKPEVLTEEQIIDLYQQAMQAIYQPAATTLSAQNADTLLNIVTLVPQLFEHAEIAERVNVKSPALARLIIQHQVWRQIEAQQAQDMQQMKLAQQQEFESLMTKFNETIKDYDKQIAKYEQTLQEFQ
ncbi:hypothetical protein [uncultured Psychrobacter sp.]|uniref:hypothetical protein n=1 Tax=uncultured Psychrobacter sp. TaxID=259303 RepID=UPI00262BE35D|nr:hypothetical protein [uncultured Psychrobacter sp.]